MLRLTIGRRAGAGGAPAGKLLAGAALLIGAMLLQDKVRKCLR
jgi:hypothetical protein